VKIEGKIPVVTAVVGYCLALSACYLMAFWGRFGINIFEYANLTDFAKMAIHPLAVLGASAAAGLVLHSVRFSLMNSGVGAGGQSDSVQWIRKSKGRIVFIFSCLGFISIWLFDFPERWLIAALLFLPLSVVGFIGLGLNRYVTGNLRQTLFILVVVFFPFCVITAGEERANSIKEGRGRIIVEKAGVASSLVASESRPLFYVGFVSGTFVIYESLTKSVVLIKQVDNAPLILKKNDKISGWRPFIYSGIF